MALYFVVHKDLFSKGDNIMLDGLLGLIAICVLVVLFFKILFSVIKQAFNIIITGISISILIVIFLAIASIATSIF